jgi:glycosyltransferase involved in cell wall biosynthesis
MQQPLISYVVTVYNKAPYVGHTARSLITQEGSLPCEYIFVDDVSTDSSIAAIEEAMRGIENVVIIRNSENRGPSVRLNQGARLARGKYLQFIDSDDILAANATLTMFSLLERHEADVIYGRWKKTGQPSASLIGTRIDDDAPCLLSDSPLDFQFRQRMLRMTQMVRRDTFLASGGCDEGVFIQDESIVLRLARVAKRFLLLDAPVVLVPAVEGELSCNVAQLNHDRFLANLHMLTEFDDLAPHHRQRFYRRCVSAMWKQRRHQRGALLSLASPLFLRYSFSKLLTPSVNYRYLDHMSLYFASLPGVRRVS